MQDACADRDILEPATVKAKWPGADLPICDLLDWCQEAADTTVLRAWVKRFGLRFVQKDSTIYRYARWLDSLPLPTLTDWIHQQVNHTPSVTVGHARHRFHKEYVQAGCPESQLTASAQSQTSRSKKRKLGE